LRADWLFIADAHLREGDFDRQARLIRFLEEEKKNLDTLVILGDLFDFWFGFDTFAFEGYRAVLNELETLVRRGVRIRYTEGNHDFALGSYFQDTLKTHIDVRESVIELGDKRVYLAHGDLVDPEDWLYRGFRRVLKNAFTYWLMRHVGPGPTKKVASILSAVSLGKQGHKRVKRVDDVFQRFAMSKFREGCDVVVLAHRHVPQSCFCLVDGREVQYFNVGDWMTHFSFLRYRPGQGFRIEYFRT
jgi:UDP-2,3-diacylglucosamine hydrolase